MKAERTMWEKIGDETFMTSCYLPCNATFNSDGNLADHKLEVTIKHPSYPGVDYI